MLGFVMMSPFAQLITNCLPCPVETGGCTWDKSRSLRNWFRQTASALFDEVNIWMLIAVAAYLSCVYATLIEQILNVRELPT